MESMTEIFKKYNSAKDFQYIFDLIFNRFQKIKCILKNNKTVFYLTDMVHKKLIETYVIVCFLTILIKFRIIDKIKLLFNLSDTDDDGLLNKAQIKLMITTINFLFCENNENNISSSIISQSLMNIFVKNKINKLMNEPGNLGIILQTEKYVNFYTFFNCLEKIPNYKYEIIPCFINIKKCLYNQRKEKMIEIKNKNKKEFVRVSSALSNTRPKGHYQLFKRSLSAQMEKIIKNVKIKKTDEDIDYYNFNNNLNSELIKKKNLLYGIKEKDKSFKELLKESTIFAQGEEEENTITKKYKKKSLSRNHNSFNPIYIFEADYDKIKKIEVEPALVKFSNDKLINKNIRRYNSGINLNGDNNNYKKIINKSTIEVNSNRNNNSNNINFRSIKSAKNNKLRGRNINPFKRSSIFPMNHKSEIIKLNPVPNSTVGKKHNLSLKNFSLSRSSLDEILEKREFKDNKTIKTNNSNKTIFKKFNNINIYKQSMEHFFSPINKPKKNTKIKFRKEINNFIKGNNINKNINMNRNKKSFIKNLKNLTYDKNAQPIKKISYNTIINKTRNGNMNLNDKKTSLVNNRINKYMNYNEVIKDLDEEEKWVNDQNYLFEKELSYLYKTLKKEKSKVRYKLNQFHESDFSLFFYNINEKIFPKTSDKKNKLLNKLK